MCNFPIRPGAKFCGNCRQPIIAPPQMIPCPHCHTPIRVGAKFCAVCGKPPINVPPIQTPIAPQFLSRETVNDSSGSKKAFIFGVMLIALIVLSIITGMVMYVNTNVIITTPTPNAAATLTTTASQK